MTTRDDLLGGLLGRRRPSSPPEDTPGQAEAAPAEAESDKGRGGLTPLDLLALPAIQRKLVNWLSRKKQATMSEITEALANTSEDRESLESALKALVTAEYVHEALAGEETQYRVVFRGTIRRGPVGLPSEIWSRVDLDHMTFLKGLPLFSGLNENQLRDVASLLAERRYQRDEVIVWQGAISEYVYLIKSGIVGIIRYSANNKDRKALAYLKQGEIFGESSSLLPDQGGVASATVTALSNVDTLLIKRGDFFKLMQKYASLGIELARILVQRQIATDLHFNSHMGTRLVLVVGAALGAGATTLGAMMACTLAHATQKPTVYTEQPDAHRLAGVFDVPATTELYRHPGGYSVLVGSGYMGMPSSVRATLVYERLVTQFDNIVIGVPSWAEEIISYLIGYADQIIVVSSPEAEAWERLTALSAMMRSLVHPERVGVQYVLNRTQPAHQDIPAPGRVDHELPYVESMPAMSSHEFVTLPEAIRVFTSTTADRLGRTNQIGLFIPTTVDVAVAADTTPYVERALAFLTERFGGATTNLARGAWNSADAGLVSEDIHIVRSYATQADMDGHLQEVLDFMAQLKGELKQEAMAVEINHKLLLI